MKSKWLDQNLTYDGSQLRSLFGYKQTGLLGDLLVSWRGPCDVSNDNMVDMVDRLQGAKIQSQDMLHFIIEVFNKPLVATVGYQRLFVGLLKDHICKSLSNDLKSLPAHLEQFYVKLQRRGNDLYFEDRKINVSIATVSPISSLIHVGVNVSTEGTPVPTMGLQDFQIDPISFAKKMMNCWVKEYMSMIDATCKTTGVS